MPTIPGELIPWIDRRFVDADGNPLDGGKVYAYVTGTVTPKDTFADAELTAANTNPVILDGTGRATIFLQSGGYDFLVTSSDDVAIYTMVNIESVAVTFLTSLGVTLGTGAVEVSSGYTVLSTDQFVTVDGTGGADPCVVNLPAVSERGLPLAIKNLGDVELAITPNGADTVDTASGVYTLAAAAGGVFPTVQLYPTSTGWLIAGSHGL